MLGKYRTDLLLLLHNLPLLITLHIGINALHGDAPSILFPTSLGKSQLLRQGSKAKDQHGRGLDNLQKQVRRFYIYQKLKVPYF
jgi:hypothetical protein